MLRSLAALILLAACQAARPAPALPVDPARAPEDLALDLAARLREREFQAAAGTFTDRMRSVLPPAKLGQVWDSLVAQLGPLQEIGATRRADEQGFRIVLVGLRFARGPADMRAVYDGEARVAGLFFVPPAAPAPAATDLREEEVTVGEGAWAVPGTITFPRTPPPWPAVVLVHGSGPSDRDGTVGANRPLRDLAHGLASEGIAVLRHEKRTRVHAARLAGVADFTVQQESIDDALAGLSLLRRTAGVEPARLFVIGHSLGATIAPRIVRQDGKLAGVVLLAPAARPLPELLLEQLAHVASLDGSVSPEEQAQMDAVRDAAQRLRTGTVAPGELVLGAPLAYWQDLAREDPVALAASLPVRILVVHGGRDYQVGSKDAGLWHAGLAGRERTTVVLDPELDHLMRHGSGPSTPASYLEAGVVAPRLIGRVAAFIRDAR